MKLPPITKPLRKSEFQDRITKEALETLESERGVLIRLGTGLGKSIIAVKIIRALLEQEKLAAPELLPFYVLLVTPKKTVLQWDKLLAQTGLKAFVKVISFGALTGKAGEVFVTAPDEDNIVWDSLTTPPLVIIDECQFIRRADAFRTKVLRALPEKIKTILLSATPFQTVSEARPAMELIGSWNLKHNAFPATPATSAGIANSIAFPASPDSLVEASMARLRNYFTEGTKQFLLEAPQARYPQKLTYTVKTFELTAPQRAWYLESFNRYLAEREKAGNSNSMSDRAAAMVAKNKLFEGAEIMAARTLCERALELTAKGFQVIIAHTHVLTQDRVFYGLVKKFNLDPARLGAINGSVTAEQAFTTQEAFNRGDLDIITLAAGAGAEGLNLAHTAEYPSARPRAIVLPTWWSAIKLAQILGRVNRYDSISDSEAFISFPAKTVFSEDVMPRVVKRLKCLKAAALAKESWMSLIDTDSADLEETEELPETEDSTSEPELAGLDGDVKIED